ncbi:MAG: hypothetical protein ACI8RZ_003619 [Myxococcota bacterium]|jgi:hypothetical protein
MSLPRPLDLLTSFEALCTQDNFNLDDESSTISTGFSRFHREMKSSVYRHRSR